MFGEGFQIIINEAQAAPLDERYEHVDAVGRADFHAKLMHHGRLLLRASEERCFDERRLRTRQMFFARSARKRIFWRDFEKLLSGRFDMIARQFVISCFGFDERKDFIRKCDFRGKLLFLFGRRELRGNIGETTRENALQIRRDDIRAFRRINAFRLNLRR